MRLAIFALSTMICAGTANASLIGDEITFSGDYNGRPFSQTGTVGTDTFSWSIFPGFDTKFNPVFTGDFIELGFSTGFPTGAWVFGPASITFSDLNWVGGTLTGASLFETVSDRDLTTSDLSFTDSSVTLILDDLFLQNGETIRLDLTKSEVGIVPLPTAGWMLLAGIGVLGVARRRKSS